MAKCGVTIHGKFRVNLHAAPLPPCHNVTADYSDRILAQLNAKAAWPMKTRIFVTLKNGVLDPQGKAIHHSLEGLGFSGVSDVRAGRLIELKHDAPLEKSQVEAMCQKLLANMVIENFEIEAA